MLVCNSPSWPGSRRPGTGPMISLTGPASIAYTGVISALGGLGSVAVGFGGRTPRASAELPAADYLGHRGHQKQLADQHLPDGEGLARVGGRDQVAVPGRGQGGEREEQVLGEAALPLGPEERAGLQRAQGSVGER